MWKWKWSTNANFATWWSNLEPEQDKMRSRLTAQCMRAGERDPIREPERVWLYLALSDSLWLTLWLSLSGFAHKADAWLTRPLLGSQRRCWCTGALYPGLGRCGNNRRFLNRNILLGERLSLWEVHYHIRLASVRYIYIKSTKNLSMGQTLHNSLMCIEFKV